MTNLYQRHLVTLSINNPVLLSCNYVVDTNLLRTGNGVCLLLEMPAFVVSFPCGGFLLGDTYYEVFNTYHVCLCAMICGLTVDFLVMLYSL